MKRKAPAKPQPVVPPEILERARRALVTDRLKKPVKCSVCGADVTSPDLPAEDSEQLCWVCRRLKISAWRDNEQQMPAQE